MPDTPPTPENLLVAKLITALDAEVHDQGAAEHLAEAVLPVVQGALAEQAQAAGASTEPRRGATDDHDELLLIALSAQTGKKLGSLYDLIEVDLDDHEAIERVLRAVLPAARKRWFAELFGTPEEIAQRELEASKRKPDDVVRLCERARPGEHARRVREQVAAEISKESLTSGWDPGGMQRAAQIARGGA